MRAVVMYGGVPRAVAGELVRSRLLDRLDRRFTSALTLVVAGPGFGKSTILAQVVRRHQLAPSGLDVWLSCGPGDEHAARFAGHWCRELDLVIGHDAASQRWQPVEPNDAVAPPDRRDRLTEMSDGAPVAASPPSPMREATGSTDALAQLVLRRLVDCSPLPICVIVDDCHLLTPGSSGAEVLAAVVRGLPAHAHLVLAGRSVPPVPTARWRAAGLVDELGADDLCFTADEVVAAAALVDRPPPADDSLGGWPALVRLAMMASADAPRDFLVEEVLSGVAPARRTELQALALLGPSTPEQLAGVLGRPVDAAALAALPLVSIDGAGRYVAHSLWGDLANDAPDPELRARVVESLMRRGDYARAGGVAIDGGEPDTIDRVVLALIRSTMSSLPVETASDWLGRLDPANPSPTVRLLDATIRHTRSPGDPAIGRDLQALADHPGLGDTPELLAAVLAVAALSAHSRADFADLFAVATRAAALPEAAEGVVLRQLRTTIAAIGADLRGDPETAFVELDGLPWETLSRRGGQASARLYLQSLWMTGRSARAVEFSDRWFAGSSTGVDASLGALSRWFDGDPSGFLGSAVVGSWDDSTANERDSFVGGCFATVMLSCIGHHDAARTLWSERNLGSRALDNARDSAHVTSARAALAVAAHDERGAVAAFTEHLARYPAHDLLGESHLRRWPALGYVLADDLRHRWEGATLGPSHAAAVDAARALVAARVGRLVAVPADGVVLTQLPLPWSSELAVRLHALGSPRAVRLVEYLADQLGAVVVDELRWIATNHPNLAAHATALIRQIPPVPTETLAISVLGPLQVARSGKAVTAAELSRSRVRQLLVLLVVERSVQRERAMDLLWPDHSPEAAAGNLRVTLTHLRRLLEPDRPAGEAGYHLRVAGSTIALHPSPTLDVDLWRADDLTQRLTGAPDTATETRLLSELVGLFRGDLLVDVADLPSVDAVRQRLHLRRVTAVLRLGELSIAAGDANRAAECAAEAIALEPFDEQAYRLALAAHLQRRDASGVTRTLQRLAATLDEIGAPPSAPTAVLMRSAAAWLAPIEHDRRIG